MEKYHGSNVGVSNGIAYLLGQDVGIGSRLVVLFKSFGLLDSYGGDLSHPKSSLSPTLMMT